jgi:tRNA(fMet)-specific endonuclease VapC
VTRCLLDTSAYSAHLAGHGETARVIREAAEIWLTPVILGELLLGFRLGTREPENRSRLRAFLQAPKVVVAGVDEETAECYCAIAADLRRRGRPVPTNDIWIAASAMQHGLAVVTHDAHFEGIAQVRTLRPG